MQTLTRSAASLFVLLSLIAGCKPQSGAAETANDAADIRPNGSEAVTGSESPTAAGIRDVARTAGVVAGSSAIAPLLSSEARLIIGDAVSTDRVRQTLHSKEFAATVRKFENDAARDRDAQDLTATYRQLISSTLGRGAALVDFSCGTSLCIGAIRTKGGNSAYTAWSEDFFTNDATPNYVFTDMSMPLGGGAFENRFFFSTDPAIGGTLTRQ